MSNDQKRRGFAALSPERMREIASLGGKASQAKGTGHKFDPDEARAAGRKGGAAVPETRPRWGWADTATPWPTPCPRCGGRLFEHPKSNCEDPACERCGKPNVACEFLDCSFTYMCTTALGQGADI